LHKTQDDQTKQDMTI